MINFLFSPPGGAGEGVPARARHRDDRGSAGTSGRHDGRDGVRSEPPQETGHLLHQPGAHQRLREAQVHLLRQGECACVCVCVMGQVGRVCVRVCEGVCAGGQVGGVSVCVCVWCV